METHKKSAFFKQLISEPSLVDDAVLDKLIAQYPYVNAFWFIRAKKAVQNGSQNAVSYFQQAALLSPSSDLLYQFINTKDASLQDKNEREITSQKEINQEFVSEETSITEGDSNPSEHPTDAASLYHDDSMPYSFLWWLNKSRMTHSENYQPYAHREKNFHIQKPFKEKDPLDQQVREHIFHIQAPELKLSSKEIEKNNPFKATKKENSIIEKFIKEEPQIGAPSPEKVSLENKARPSAIDQSGFVSETLARIYTEQGLYHKAIETYKKLSLKFPEKSPYFADLIKQLEKQN